MTQDEYNAFCATLPATSHVVQWGGSDVWKVGGKVFAVGGTGEDGLTVSFKVSEMAFEMLSHQPGCRPAPYLASRGMKWIQRTSAWTMDDAALCDYLRDEPSPRLAPGPHPQGARGAWPDCGLIDVETLPDRLGRRACRPPRRLRGDDVCVRRARCRCRDHARRAGDSRRAGRSAGFRLGEFYEQSGEPSRRPSRRGARRGRSIRPTMPARR